MSIRTTVLNPSIFEMLVKYAGTLYVVS